MMTMTEYGKKQNAGTISPVVFQYMIWMVGD